MKLPIVKKIGVILVVVLFFLSVPFAMVYNINYDRYGGINATAPTIFIQISMIDTPTHNNTFRIRASEYMAKHKNVKIFIIVLSAEQSNPMRHDIKIVRDDTTLHAFISNNQTNSAIQHSNDFLDFVAEQNQLVIKRHQN